MSILQARRLRFRDVTLQGSQREEEQGFQPGSDCCPQASLPSRPGAGTRQRGFLLLPSGTHCSPVSAVLPSCPPAHHCPV